MDHGVTCAQPSFLCTPPNTMHAWRAALWMPGAYMAYTKSAFVAKVKCSSATERALSFSEAKGWNPKELDINAQGKTFVVTVLTTVKAPLILSRERMPALDSLLPRPSPSAYASPDTPL